MSLITWFGVKLMGQSGPYLCFLIVQPGIMGDVQAKIPADAYTARDEWKE
jgi:hypothetical protein